MSFGGSQKWSDVPNRSQVVHLRDIIDIASGNDEYELFINAGYLSILIVIQLLTNDL